MYNGASCRCCLVRPPDKDLYSSYSRLGKPEVYSDMLKECFEIDLPDYSGDEDTGICEICIMRLRDASDFKHQVQRCQLDFRSKLLSIKDEPRSKVKEELAELDEENGIYFLEIKDEMSDFEDEMLKEDEDDHNKDLAKIVAFDNVSIKRCTSKKLTSKPKKDRKKKHGSLKLSLRTLTTMNEVLHAPKLLPPNLVSPNTKHRLNVENLLKHSNCTPFSNKTLSGIICAYCKEAYSDIQQLRTHIAASHSKEHLIDHKRLDKSNLSLKIDISDLQCKLCHTPCDVIATLKKHLINKHDIKFYPDIHDYVLEFKLTDGEILNCALCNSTFETFKMLLQHMNGHYRNYICDICDLGFINKHKLRNHQRTHEIGTFNCSFCDKVFSTRVRKICHEKYTHNSSARYTTNCPHCDESFTSYYQRNRHMARAHNTSAATYKCNICDKSFILKSKLTSHIKKVHLMERNHICAECGQGFFIKQSLDEHMIKHNGERIYKCTVCNKAYARKKTLREHMRIHNNDRRFKCGMCPLAFVQKCSLKSHMLSNHGITLAEYESAKTVASSP